MPVQVGSPAPDFKTKAYLRDSDEFKEIALADYKGKWVCLYFYTLDFSGVCPTEVAAFDGALDEFQKRGCDLVACSCDSHYAHKGWCESNESLNALKHPLLSDMTKRMAMDYGVLLPDQGVPLRGTYLIDPEGTIRWAAVYDKPIGRNIAEILRVLDALQTGEACACNWTP